MGIVSKYLGELGKDALKDLLVDLYEPIMKQAVPELEAFIAKQGNAALEAVPNASSDPTSFPLPSLNGGDRDRILPPITNRKLPGQGIQPAIGLGTGNRGVSLSSKHENKTVEVIDMTGEDD